MSGAVNDPCELLKWDTDFFGFRIARVRGDSLSEDLVKGIDSWCRQEKIRCLYFLSRADDPETTRLAEDNGFRMVDIRVTLSLRIPGERREIEKRRRSEATIRHACSQDTSGLLRIAGNSFYDTRFYFDANFPRHLVDSLYEIWVQRSLDSHDDAVLVAELDGSPVGFGLCRMDAEPGVGILCLTAVSEEVRGRGIGQDLINGGLDWFSGRGVNEVYAVNQGRNVDMLRLNQHCGILIREVQIWYHKWFDG